MTGIKQSDFTAVTSVDDADNIPLFTRHENKRISYESLRAQLSGEIEVRFIYPTIAQLQQSNLEADEDEPSYVRCEETEYRLYKITSLAAGVDDIALDNGRTASYQEEYSKSGFVLGPSSSTNNALALFDGTTGAQLKTGAVLSTIGGNIASVAAIAQVSYPRADASNAVAMATPTTLKSDLSLPANTSASISTIEGDIATIEGDIVDINDALDITAQTVETWASIATVTPTAAGQLFALAQHTSGGLGGGTLMAFVGSVTDDGGTQKNCLGGYFLKRIYGALSFYDFGAQADGSTDDYYNCQLALNTGKNIVALPTTSYYKLTQPLLLTAVGQTVTGFGLFSKFVQTGSNANANVFVASSKGKNEFRNLYAIPGTTVSALSDGWGFALFNCDNSLVSGCRVTGSRHGGIIFQDCNAGKIIDNWITDTVVASGGIQSQSGIDIYLSGNSRRFTITGNHCINSCGMGIAVQTLISTDFANENIISNNYIQNCGVYGIMLYILNSSSTVNKTIIDGNIIRTVTGATTQDDLQAIYGAGMYIQTAEDTVITNNQINDTCSSTTVDTNAPAAISVNGVANCIIANNKIEAANKWGITCAQATAYAAAGRGLIVHDNIVASKNAAIYTLDCVSANIHDNRLIAITSGAAQGIRLRQAVISQCDDYSVHDNRIYDFGVGIEESGAISESHIHNNIIRGNTGFGIDLRAAFVNCHDNRIVNGSLGNGINVGSTCTSGFVKHNSVSGGAYGILDDNGATVSVFENQFIGTTTDFSSYFYRPLANSATPSAKNARFASSAFTTTITNFTDGYKGQIMVFKANAALTIQSGAGIDLNGGANFVMTANDTVTLLKDSSSWTELARSTA